MAIEGTHQGLLSIEARERRRIKNAGNRSRVHPESKVHGLDMPKRGSQSKHRKDGLSQRGQ